MNKVKFIASSKALLSVMKQLDSIVEESIDIIAARKLNHIKFKGTEISLNCELSNDFIGTLYAKTITSFIKHLKLIDEQPVTLEIEDSDLFNIKICEMYV